MAKLAHIKYPTSNSLLSLLIKDSWFCLLENHKKKKNLRGRRFKLPKPNSTAKTMATPNTGKAKTICFDIIVLFIVFFFVSYKWN